MTENIQLPDPTIPPPPPEGAVATEEVILIRTTRKRAAFFRLAFCDRLPDLRSWAALPEEHHARHRLALALDALADVDRALQPAAPTPNPGG